MHYAATLKTTCKSCNTTHTVDRDEDGAPDLATETCTQCNTELCTECPQFQCDGCNQPFCAHHRIEVEEIYSCICLTLVEGEDDPKACRACYPRRRERFCRTCFLEIDFNGATVEIYRYEPVIPRLQPVSSVVVMPNIPEWNHSGEVA